MERYWPATSGTAFIAVSEEDEKEGFASGVLWGRLTGARRWLVRTPVAVTLVNGRVVRVFRP